MIKIKILKLILLITLCLCAFIIYDLNIGSNRLIQYEYKLEVNNEGSLKIVNIADIHYGFEITEEEIGLLVDAVNETNPDIIVFSGDLIDDYSEVVEFEKGLHPLIEAMSNLEATYGKFSVYGNRDYYCNTYISPDTYRYIMEASGFQVLRNNSVSITKDDVVYELIGLDDYGLGSPDFLSTTAGNTLYDYRIVIVHEPDYIKLLDDYEFDLYLAGHSHGGQIRIPFYGPLYTTNAAEDYVKGLYEYSDEKTIIVTSGVGKTRIKYRLFNPPSYDSIRLEGKK